MNRRPRLTTRTLIHAASLAIPASIGYASGAAILVLWMRSRESANPSRNGFETEILWNRYRITSDYVRVPLPSTGLTLITIFAVAISILIIVRRSRTVAKFAFRLPHPEQEAPRFHRAWSSSFRLGRITKNLLITTLFVGLATPVFGLAIDSLVRELKFQLSIRSAAPQIGNLYPTPLIGWLTLSEAIWMTAGLFAIAYWHLGLPGKRIMLASGPITRRWCRHCGFHLGLGKQRKNTAPARCPECGKETGPMPN